MADEHSGQRSILSPKNDFVFKQIFGDAEDIEPLAAFLQAALGLPEEEFAEFTIIDPNLNPRFDGDKHCILDVRIKTRSGREVDIEIQVRSTPEIYNRIQYYTAKMVTGQVKAGEGYGAMPQSISIVIADFRMWERSGRYHHRFRLFEADEGFEYPNSMEIHTLELPKLPEDSDGTKLWNWLKFMSSETRDEFESLAGKDTVMAKMVGKLAQLSEDEAARLRAEAHEKWLWDYNAGMRDSRRKGLAEGLAEGEARGEAKKSMEIARQLIRLHLSFDDIAKATGLSQTEIESLAEAETLAVL